LGKIVKLHLVYLARCAPLLPECDTWSYGKTRVNGPQFAERFPVRRDCAASAESRVSMLRQQLVDSSRGRIVTLLRHGGLTVDDIASQLGLTPNAVRAQMSGMERDGVVRRVGRPGTTRPSHVFELTPEVEQLLSEGPSPFLTQLVSVFANALPAEQIDTLMRDVGKGLGNDLAVGRRPSGGLRARPSVSRWKVS
jgi:DNA-binding MarR family transcriptional regulator